MAGDFNDIAIELADIGQGLYSRGWMLGTSGNLSAVVSRDPTRLAITASGVDKGALTARQILELGPDGAKLGDQTGRPSAETRLHIGLVEDFQAGAVLHTHSVWSTIVSDHFFSERGFWIEGHEMLKGLSGIATHDHREWIPILGNSQDMEELWERMQGALKSHRRPHGVLIRRHGLYTWGANLSEARRHVEILEFLLEVTGRTLSL